MKKLLLCACAALVLAACNDNDDQPRFAAENTKVENGSLTGSNIHFLGTSTVTSADGDVYVDPQSDFEFAGLRDFTLYMHRTRFAAAMPAMEMRLYAQPYTPGTGASLSFALPSVVPQVSIPNAVGGGMPGKISPPTRSPTCRAPSTTPSAASVSRATSRNWAPTASNTRAACSNNPKPNDMKPEYKPFVDELVELCIKEDIGDGDHTSLCCIPADEQGRMRLLCKEEGTIAGIEIAELVLRRLDPP